MDTLIQMWIETKAQEKAATAKRIEIEKKILKQIETPAEGTTHVGELTITTKINRKIDSMAAKAVGIELGQLNPISWIEEPKLDLNGYRWLKDNEPGYFKILSRAITETPAKPSFSEVKK